MSTDNAPAEADASASVPEQAAKPGMFSALRHRDFALLWSGQALSAVGNQMFPIILAILVLQRKSGASGLGLILAVQAIALAIGMLLAASLGDTWPRTRVMFSTDAIRALGVTAIAIAPIRLPTSAFVVLVIAIGVAEGMFTPAYSAVMPRLLPESSLQAGNALTALSQYTAMVAGPLIAGTLLATIGAGPSLWVDVGTFGASLGTLILIKEKAKADQAEEGSAGGLSARRAFSDLAAGIRAVRERPWVGATIGAMTILMTLSVAPAFVAAPIVAREHFGGSTAYGAMFAALGVGSVVGSVLGGKIHARRRGVIALLGLFVIVGSVGSLAFLPLAGILVFWGIAGIGVTVSNILWTTALQEGVPDHLLGRVMALDWLGSMGLMPIGYALAGVVISAVGVRDMLVAGAIIVVVVVPLPLFVPGGTTFRTPVDEEG
jgi:MFS family permease